MTTAAPVRPAVCECGHHLAFHVDLRGNLRPCDHETVTPYGMGEVPSLCGCAAYKEQAA